MIKNTTETYGTISKLIHWCMAILIIVMLLVGYYMRPETNHLLLEFHKSTGLLLLSLVVIRLGWRFLNIQPSLPTTIPYWQHVASKMAIVALYFLMIFMPLTGLLMTTLGGYGISFYGLFTIPPLEQDTFVSAICFKAHNTLAYIFIAVLALHLMGALYHHFILKDNVLKRMWKR